MRREDWPERLVETLEAAKNRGFFFASHGHDCTSFAAACVTAMTDRDFTQDFPQYAAEEEAAAILKDYGGVAALADRCLGERIAVAFAQRGDVVLVPTPRGDALGICIGVNAAFAGPRGLTMRPMNECTMAWRVE